MPKKDKGKCKAVEGCNKPVKAMGFCPTHYAQLLRGVRDLDGNLLRELRASYADGQTCIVDGCKQSPFAKGFCRKHYQPYRYGRLDETGKSTDQSQWKSYYNPNRKTSKSSIPCSLESCNEGRVNKDPGFCSYHNRRFVLGLIDKDGNVLREDYRVAKYGPDDVCRVDNCSRRPRSNHFCKYHAQLFSTGGIDADGNKLRPKCVGRPKKEKYRQNFHGYILVRPPEGHATRRKDGMIFEHRLVMEQQLGRYLEPDEVVHHKDGDRANNDPSNLEVMRKRKHPIALEYAASETDKALQALKHNDRESFEEVLTKNGDVETAISTLENMIDTGMPDDLVIKRRLRKLVRRLGAPN